MHRLVSHPLCPYVQRAAIALAEKGVPFERRDVDLAQKPDWFKALSPLGKVPLLLVDGRPPLFESAAICDYIEESEAGPRLHPEDAFERARHRGWIEFASAMLNLIAGYYSAPDAAALAEKQHALAERIATLETALGNGPYFAGERFSLVDAAFAPVFRYFEVFERFHDAGFFAAFPRVRAWRAALADRPSVAAAAAPDYAERLTLFLRRRGSALSRLMG
jgi:glutathione S-transferase